ncbi:hypothetical protein O181_013503 [Austropuccinia psidii MF-1]|uniref:Uncharacterized protein n=1 Tax=Austropuccinia psidii MF-1 TaxID=1389203 RepID=A0A9Q3BZC8_9BASI|nr:hypothetical protein [Austropuccinia psidii MF-1]
MHITTNTANGRQDSNDLSHVENHFTTPLLSNKCISFQDTMPSLPLPSSIKSKPVVKTWKSPAPTPNLTSTIKRNPIQMQMRDAPPDFKYTKEALYVQIKLLWGILTPAAMPTAPDKQLLKEFYQQFSSAEENIPIDFYRPEWFNQKNHSEKQIVADLSEFSFVPIRDLPPGPKQHPDEQLGDWAFNQKYWHSTIKEYKIKPNSPDRSDSYSVASSIGDESVDLNEEHDFDNNLLEKEIIKNEKSKVELEPEEKKGDKISVKM